MSNKSSFTRFSIINRKFCIEKKEANYNFVGSWQDKIFRLSFEIPSSIFCYISFRTFISSSRTFLQICLPLKFAGESTFLWIVFDTYAETPNLFKPIALRRLVMNRSTWSKNAVHTYWNWWALNKVSKLRFLFISFNIFVWNLKSYLLVDSDSFLSIAPHYPLIQRKIFNNIWSTYGTFY